VACCPDIGIIPSRRRAKTARPAESGMIRDMARINQRCRAAIGLPVMFDVAVDGRA